MVYVPFSLPQHKATFDAIFNLGHQVLDVTLQVGDGEFLLVDVGGVGTAGEGAHCSQVAGVTTLSLYDKHSSLRS